METTRRHTSCTVSDLKTSLFESLTPSQLNEVEKGMIIVNYKKGEIICRQGSFASHIIYVKEGLAKVYLEGCSETLVLKVIPPNNVIALTAILEDNIAFPYSAQAYRATSAVLIDINIIRRLIKENALFASTVINILCANSQQVFGRFYCLTHKQLYGRLADIILCLSERIFKQSTFQLDMSRKELAELTKMSTESVIRMLKKFREDGLIEIEGKTFTVKDFDLLRTISERG